MVTDVFATTEGSYIDVKLRISDILSKTIWSINQLRNLSMQILDLNNQNYRINLLFFDGDQLGEGFRDLYKSLVYDVETLSPTQKLQY